MTTHLISKILTKHKSFIKQFLRYFGVALIGYVVDFGMLTIFVEVFNVHYLVSASIGFILGLIVTYLLSSRFVFGESKIKSKKREFSLFAGIGIIGLVLLNIIMWFFTDLIGINYILSKIIATVFVYMWNFLARRRLYYNEV
ncbi:MAG: GtrA family protein [Candidatus Microsaccharimonas sp.]